MSPSRRLIKGTQLSDLNGHYIIKSGDGEDQAKTAVMIYEDGSKYMLNVAAIPESYRNEIKEYFVLDDKDLAVVKAVIENESVERAVEILKDLKSFCAHHPKKHFYLRQSALEERMFFCDEIYIATVVLLTEPRSRQLLKVDESWKMNPYDMTSLAMIARAPVEFRTRVTILDDFVELKSRKLAWSSKEIEPIYTYNGSGEKVVRRTQTAFHIFRSLYCGLQCDCEHCCRNNTFMEKQKALAMYWTKEFITNKGDDLMVYHDLRKAIPSSEWPNRKPHEKSKKPDFHFSTKNPTDEIPLQEYIDICRYFNISAYPSFLWENGEKKETIPVWVVRVQLAAEWIKDSDFSEAIKKKLRFELLDLQPVKGVRRVLIWFLTPNLACLHKRMNWFPLDSSPSSSLQISGNKRNEILRMRKEAKKAGKGHQGRASIDKKITDQQICGYENRVIENEALGDSIVEASKEVEDQYYGLESRRKNYLATTYSGILKFLNSEDSTSSSSSEPLTSKLSRKSTSSDPSTSQLPSTERFQSSLPLQSQEIILEAAKKFGKASDSEITQKVFNEIMEWKADGSTPDQSARNLEMATSSGNGITTSSEDSISTTSDDFSEKSSESSDSSFTIPKIPKDLPTSEEVPTSLKLNSSEILEETSSGDQASSSTEVSTSSENLEVKSSESTSDPILSEVPKSTSSKEHITSQNQNSEILTSSEILESSPTSSEGPEATSSEKAMLSLTQKSEEFLTLSEEVKQLKIALKESKKRTNNALAALKSTQEELFRTQNLLEKSEKNEEIMTGRWKEEEKNLRNGKKSYDKLEKGLRSEMDIMRNEIKQLKSEKTQLVNTEEALKDARAECKLLTQKNKNLKELLKKASNTKELSKAREELEVRTDWNTKLDFKNLRLQKTNDRLTRENDELMREINEFKKMKESDQMEIQRLTSKILRLDNRTDYTEMIQKTEKLEKDLKILKKNQEEQASIFQLVAPSTTIVPIQAPPTFPPPTTSPTVATSSSRPKYSSSILKSEGSYGYSTPPSADSQRTTVASPRCFVCQKMIEKNQKTSKCRSCQKETHNECAQSLRNNDGTCWCCGKRV